MSINKKMLGVATAVALMIPTNVSAEGFVEVTKEKPVLSEMGKKRDLPVYVKGFKVISSTEDSLKFNLHTDKGFGLKVTYSKVDDKASTKTLEYKNTNENFLVQLPLESNQEYSVDITLTDGTRTFSTTMVTKMEGSERTVSNPIDENNMNIVQDGRPIYSLSQDEYEGNDTIASATNVANNVDVTGTLSSGNDNDLFKITLKQTQKINVFLGNVPAGYDYDLQLYTESGSVFYKSANGAGSNELIADKILPAGVYYARVYSYNSNPTNPGAQYLFRWKATQSWPTESLTSADISQGFKPPTHNGIDIARYGWSPNVVAAFDGTVTDIGYNTDNRGNYVTIEGTVNGGTLQTRYYHMVDGSLTVGLGYKVIAGQKIGVMGTTGQSTGIHLHFETRQGTGYYATAVNPLNYFPTSTW